MLKRLKLQGYQFHTRVHLRDHSFEDYFQRCSVTFVVSWYRPPKSTVHKFFELKTLLDCLETFNKEITLMGDTNQDLISCENNIGTADHM